MFVLRRSLAPDCGSLAGPPMNMVKKPPAVSVPLPQHSDQPHDSHVLQPSE